MHLDFYNSVVPKPGSSIFRVPLHLCRPRSDWTQPVVIVSRSSVWVESSRHMSQSRVGFHSGGGFRGGSGSFRGGRRRGGLRCLLTKAENSSSCRNCQHPSPRVQEIGDSHDSLGNKLASGISDISSILILGLVKMFCKLEFEGGQTDSVPDGPFTGTS